MKMNFVMTMCLMLFAANLLPAQNTSQDYADYLMSNAEEPFSFVLSKLKDYRIVAIGEDH